MCNGKRVCNNLFNGDMRSNQNVITNAVYIDFQLAIMLCEVTNSPFGNVIKLFTCGHFVPRKITLQYFVRHLCCYSDCINQI